MRPTLLSLPLLALPGLAAAAPPAVVTDIPAVQSLVAQVMGDLGTPDLLLEKGANAHNYQLRPSQARALSEADLLIWIGPEMTPWLARNASDGDRHALSLLHAPGTLIREFGHESEAEAHDAKDHAEHDTHAHDTHDAAEHDHEAEHDHDGLDPHAWLDPANARIWLGLIAEELAHLDAPNAAIYRANAQAAQDRTDQLLADLTAMLEPVADKPFVVFHDAYGYFAGRFDLHVAGAVALGDAAAPGAQHLGELRETLTQAGVVCAFPEAQHDPKLLAQLVEGSAVRLGATLDPAGSAQDPGPGLYDALIRGMGAAIADCLGQD